VRQDERESRRDRRIRVGVIDFFDGALRAEKREKKKERRFSSDLVKFSIRMRVWEGGGEEKLVRRGHGIIFYSREKAGCRLYQGEARRKREKVLFSRPCLDEKHRSPTGETARRGGGRGEFYSIGWIRTGVAIFNSMSKKRNGPKALKILMRPDRSLLLFGAFPEEEEGKKGGKARVNPSGQGR